MKDSDFRKLWMEPRESPRGAAFEKLERFNLPRPVRALASEWAWFGSSLGLEPDAFLGEGEEVAIAFYGGESCVELILEPDGLISLFVEKGIGFEFEEVEEVSPASPMEIESRLRDLAVRRTRAGKTEWTSFGSLDWIGGTRGVGGSPMWPSSAPPEKLWAHRMEERGSQSSIFPVPAETKKMPKNVFAPILMSTTEIASPAPSPIGDSDWILYENTTEEKAGRSPR